MYRFSLIKDIMCFRSMICKSYLALDNLFSWRGAMNSKLNYQRFGTNFANIVVVTHAPPGKYLIRRALDARTKAGLTITNSTTSYVGIVDFPTSYGSLVARILLRGNSSEEAFRSQSYRDQIKLTSIPRTSRRCDSTPTPALNADLITTDANESTPRQVLSLLARLAPFNSPVAQPERSRVSNILSLAGLQSGGYNARPDVNLTQAWKVANATIVQTLHRLDNIRFVGNGWILPAEKISVIVSACFQVRFWLTRL